MRIFRLQALAMLFGIGLLTVSAGLAAAAEIKCGDQLGPGGMFVLTRDLTCATNPDDVYESALSVVDGAILDLNGHTVTCDRKQFGIAVVRATLMNGTVKGCGEGVMPHESVVTHMTLIENGWGVYIQGKHDNLIIDNTAIHNAVGFGLEDGSNRNTFIGNTAIGDSSRAHTWGFISDSGEENVFIDNTAVGNSRSGFRFYGDRLRLVGNVAKRNGEGFTFEEQARLRLIGNVARRNVGHGFTFGRFLGWDGERVVVRNNVANRNGGDGFLIKPGGFDGPGDVSASVFKNNHVLSNGGHGIHVQAGGVWPPRVVALNATIRGNTVLGHTAPYFDLANDNVECEDGAVWEDNVFETASQPCVE